MSVVLHKIHDVVIIRSMFAGTSYLSGAVARIDRLETNGDGTPNGVVLVTLLSDSDTHRVKGQTLHVGTSILVSEPTNRVDAFDSGAYWGTDPVADDDPANVRGCSCGMATYGDPGHDGGNNAH